MQNEEKCQEQDSQKHIPKIWYHTRHGQQIEKVNTYIPNGHFEFNLADESVSREFICVPHEGKAGQSTKRLTFRLCFILDSNHTSRPTFRLLKSQMCWFKQDLSFREAGYQPLHQSDRV